MDLHITLLSAAIAALLNVLLAVRILQLRFGAKIIHGDGGNPLLARRMRAQANFIEYTPVFLVLVLVLELDGHGGWLLGIAALVFLLGRALHPLGMDAEQGHPARIAGTLTTFPVLIGLAIAALLAAFRVI